MKKKYLSVCFVVFGLFLQIPVFADSELPKCKTSQRKSKCRAISYHFLFKGGFHIESASTEGDVSDSTEWKRLADVPDRTAALAMLKQLVMNGTCDSAFYQPFGHKRAQFKTEKIAECLLPGE